MAYQTDHPQCNYLPIQRLCHGCYPSQSPLEVCLDKSVQTLMEYGSTGAGLGPESSPCQQYLVDRCSQRWDGACDYYYNKYQQIRDTRIPFACTDGICAPNRQPWGNCLLGESAKRRFLNYDHTQRCVQQVDPSVPDSPWVTTRITRDGMPIEPICTHLDVDNLDNDPIMNRCLANPVACAYTLGKIKDYVDQNNIDLRDTKLGKFFHLTTR